MSKRDKPISLERLAMAGELSGEAYIHLTQKALAKEDREEISDQHVQNLADYWRKRLKQE